MPPNIAKPNPSFDLKLKCSGEPWRSEPRSISPPAKRFYNLRPAGFRGRESSAGNGAHQAWFCAGFSPGSPR